MGAVALALGLNVLHVLLADQDALAAGVGVRAHRAHGAATAVAVAALAVLGIGVGVVLQQYVDGLLLRVCHGITAATVAIVAIMSIIIVARIVRTRAARGTKREGGGQPLCVILQVVELAVRGAVLRLLLWYIFVLVAVLHVLVDAQRPAGRGVGQKARSLDDAQADYIRAEPLHHGAVAVHIHTGVQKAL